MATVRTWNVLRIRRGIWKCVGCRSNECRIQNKIKVPSLGNEAAGPVAAAIIKSTPSKRLRVTGNVAVATVDGSPIVKIGNDQDIGLVIPRAGFDPTLNLACIIGGAKVCVSDTASDLEATKLVYQKDINHTGHRITAING